MKATLESLFTRIPMYLLTIGSLAVLIMLAFIYSLRGMVYFSPQMLVASTVVFSIAAVGSSWLLGKMYGVYSYLQSAVITALILVLLFTPSSDVITLAKYAIIAAIAMASKFIVTYKGRHIFNPAAFGAVLGGLFGLAYTSWWIGTPTFIVAVALAAAAVLYKTRQLTLGLVFVGLSATIIAISGATNGEPLQTMLLSAITSWPIVFLAGFMLSEPLTQPPRRSQKFLVAAVVAIITSLPFHFGWFNSSPAFALLVGNALAFVLGFRQRRDLQLRLKERSSLTPTTEEYVFSSPVPVYFSPGQYIELTLPHAHADIRGSRRSFSITSMPGETNIRLGVKFYNPSSSFKKSLRALPLGSPIQATGITGDFVLPKDARRKLLFVAGGIGVTPFISHIRSMAAEKRTITLLYFNRSPEEAAYKELLDSSGIIVHYFVATRETREFLHGDRVSEELLRKYVPDMKQREVYISGPPVMVAEAARIARKETRRVHTDYFSGY